MVETGVQPAAGGVGGAVGTRGGARDGGATLAGLSTLQRISTAGLIPEGEAVILAIKPSRWFLLLSRGGLWVGWLIALLAAWWLGPLLDTATGARGVIPLVLAAGVAIMLLAALDWQTRLYLLTDRRIVRIAGILRQTVREIPLRNIQSVTLTKSLRERLTGVGSLGVSSAGSDGYEVAWWMIGKPEETLRRVRETIDRYGPPGGPGGAGGVGGVGNMDGGGR